VTLALEVEGSDARSFWAQRDEVRGTRLVLIFLMHINSVEGAKQTCCRPECRPARLTLADPRLISHAKTSIPEPPGNGGEAADIFA
jgi:hypothetical protein